MQENNNQDCFQCGCVIEPLSESSHPDFERKRLVIRYLHRLLTVFFVYFGEQKSLKKRDFCHHFLTYSNFPHHLPRDVRQFLVDNYRTDVHIILEYISAVNLECRRGIEVGDSFYTIKI